MIRQFDEAGVKLSDPCDETKAMMEVELERWEKEVSCLAKDYSTWMLADCISTVFARLVAGNYTQTRPSGGHDETHTQPSGGANPASSRHGSSGK